MQPPHWIQFIETLFSSATPLLAGRNDLIHARMSHHFARIMLRRQGGDRRIVEPAIILHDVGWSRLSRTEIQSAYGVKAHGDKARQLNRRHEVAGAAIARELLISLDYDPEKIEMITAIILRHDSGGFSDSLEESIVKDADKIWRFCRIGFWYEVRRQNLSPWELCDHLAGYGRDVFFTPSGWELARCRLDRRLRECEKREGADHAKR